MDSFLYFIVAVLLPAFAILSIIASFTNASSKTLLGIGAFVVIAAGLFSSSSSITQTFDSNECSGVGGAECESEVRAHINSQNGKEVNYVRFVGDGKFAVNVLDITDKGLTKGGSYGATVYVDCDCNVTSVRID